MLLLRVWFAVVLLPLCLHGQFHSLATTGDGETLYFVTSYRLKGSTLSGQPRIWKYSQGHFEIIVEPPCGEPEDPLNSIDGVSVSADGRTLSYYTQSNNGRLESYLVDIESGTMTRVDGSLDVSRSGRYVMTHALDGPSPWILFDRQREGRWEIPSNCLVFSGSSITDDGRVLGCGGLWSSTGIRPITLPGSAIAVSPSGRWIASQQFQQIMVRPFRFEWRYSISLTDAETGVSRDLTSNETMAPFSPFVFSDDERWLQVGNRLLSITLGPGGHRTETIGTISSDASIAYGPGGDQIDRIALFVPDRMTVIPRTGMLQRSTDSTAFAVPGSILPWVWTIEEDEASVRIGGADLTPLRTTYSRELLVPIELPLGVQNVTVSTVSRSPFEPALGTIEVLRARLYWLGANNYSLTRPSEPLGLVPRPDEIIRFTLSGVGRDPSTRAILPVRARYCDEATSRCFDLAMPGVTEADESPGRYDVLVRTPEARLLTPVPNDPALARGWIEFRDLASTRDHEWIRTSTFAIRLRD